MIREINTSLTREEAHSSDCNEVEDVNSAAPSLSVPITSEEVARRIRATTDLLTKQLQKLCNLMKELGRDTARRDEVISASTQGASGPRGDRYDTRQTGFLLTKELNIPQSAMNCRQKRKQPPFSQTLMFFDTKGCFYCQVIKISCGWLTKTLFSTFIVLVSQPSTLMVPGALIKLFPFLYFNKLLRS